MGWTLVTGAAKGLGREICLQLAAKGHAILVHYRHSQHLAEELTAECRRQGGASELICGDFATLDSTQRFIEECLQRFPDIQHLVNNVGEYVCKPALETSAEEWLRVFQSNLHLPCTLIQAFLPSIRAQQGCIVNVGVAGAGLLQADLKRTAYRLAKTSLYLLTKSLAKQLAPEGVRVNMVSPGYLEQSVDLPEKTLPMQRLGRLTEAARVVAFFFEKESSYITGQNIEVAGGVAL
jgi:NAD(P)-dependent dehydrogenase (short-subunit alcohol dehydrogenase family)